LTQLKDDDSFTVIDHIVSHLGNIPIRICSEKRSVDNVKGTTASTTTTTTTTTTTSKDRLAKVLVLGDIHSSLFFHGKMDAIENPSRNFRSSFYNKVDITTTTCIESNYQTCIVNGATAYGLKNNNSLTKAKLKFEKCISKFLGELDYVAIMLGEVDMARMCKARKVHPFDQIIQSTSNLFKFVANVTEKFGLRMNQVIHLYMYKICVFVTFVICFSIKTCILITTCFVLV
jgi:hypothetical protein